LQAVAERVEMADAVAGLTDGFGSPMRAGDPLYPLACEVASALIEAGFTLHRCAPHHPLYRLGGVCLLPVARAHEVQGRDGIVVLWTTHDLLSRDWERWDEYHGAHAAMNEALGKVLRALDFAVSPFGSGGAWIVTANHEHGGGADR